MITISGRKKIVLTLILLALAALLGSVVFTVANKTDETKQDSLSLPDPKRYMSVAIKEFESAENAFIYKDYAKAQKFLEKSEIFAQRAVNSQELSKEAQDLLKKVKNKKIDIDKAVEEQKRAEEEQKNKEL